jgi:glyoxylase-like metal-dependent hydrolase (beta-lactamase superfamily II)
MKKSIVAICALLLAIGMASPQPAAAQFSVQPIAGGVYIVKFTNPAFNMNNLLVVDPAGVVLVDTLPTMPNLDPPYKMFYPFSATIHKVIGMRPVDTIINTHWHYDHVGLNDRFRLWEGTQAILAHWRVGAYLVEQHCMPDMPAPNCMPYYPQPESQPTVGIRGEKRLNLQNETLILKDVENAHSGADLFVYLENANILYTGDIYFGGIYPIIDRAGGGTLNGTLAALRHVLARIDDRTIVVPPHGAVGNRASVEKFVEMLENNRWQIRQLIARGATEEEVMNDPYLAAMDKDWESPFINGPTFRKVLYRDLAPQGK